MNTVIQRLNFSGANVKHISEITKEIFSHLKNKTMEVITPHDEKTSQNAITYANFYTEVVSINIDKYEDDFQTEAIISEFGRFGFECKIFGHAKRQEDPEVNHSRIDVLDFDLDLVNAYEDGEVINVTYEEQREIEEAIKKNIILDIYED